MQTADRNKPAVSGRPQSANQATKAPARLARTVTWIAALSAAPLAFIAALWLIHPHAPVPAVAALANATVSDATSLMAAVQSAGLHGTSDIKGAIDQIRRLDNERVEIRGWAADANSSGSPLTMVAFVDKAYILTATSDAGTGLPHLLGLSGPAATNTSFQGTLVCTRAKKVVIVAVTTDRRYSQFRSITCP